MLCRYISTGHLHTLLCFQIRPINPIVYREPQKKPHLETGFPLRCFQRLSLPYVANQPCHGRDNWRTRGMSVPSRTRDSLSQVSTRTADRDRTVSRRSKPSSRAALMGEQPNPWTYSSPRMRRADIEVPNHPVDMDSWGRSACYPRGTFYPLSDTASTSRCRITSPYFRTCSTCQSHSQAPLCTYTQHLIANQAEGTFGRLRYSLGGNRPS